MSRNADLGFLLEALPWEMVLFSSGDRGLLHTLLLEWPLLFGEGNGGLECPA